MPDIEIVVEASLGDSLAKLGLAKHAVSDLGDSGDETSHKLRDFNSAMDDTTIASHKAGETILKTDHLIRGAETAITDVTSAIDGGGGGGGFLAGLNSMGNELTTTIPLLGQFGAPLIALPVIIFGVVAAVVALADTIGTLIAIAADLVAPITLITGLLGGLGVGFFLAAKQVFGGGGALAPALDMLKHQFDNLTKTLGKDFMPVFEFLVHNAHDALTYLNQIAKLPLDQAFKSLATTGVQAVTKFLGEVGHLVAHPIRLAFQIAFGTGKGGNEVASAVSGLWKQFTDFLFGYSKQHPVQIAPHTFVMTTKTVDGVLQPFLDWFNRHHFTAQGIKIGHEMLSGFLDSGTAQRLGQFIIQVLEDAGKTAFHALVGYARQNFLLIVQALEGVRLGFVLISAFKSAWPSIVSAAQDAWNKIKGIFSHALSVVLHIIPDIPSIPGLSGSGSASTAPGNARLGAQGGGGRAGASVVLAPQFHYHDHGGAGRGSFRRFAHEVGREIQRQQAVGAGGV